MTIRIEVPFSRAVPDDRFVVEISRDGEISFPGFEERFEYDIAFKAMGGDESVMALIWRQWQVPYGQAVAIQSYLGLEWAIVRRLAHDWVAHIAEIYEDAMPDGEKFQEALGHLLESIRRDAGARHQDEALSRAEHTLNTMWPIVHGALNDAAAMAYDALNNLAKWGMLLGFLRSSCAQARAYAAAIDSADVIWEKASLSECDWQIRRFHDVVQAVQQGKPWPALEKTP